MATQVTKSNVGTTQPQETRREVRHFGAPEPPPATVADQKPDQPAKQTPEKTRKPSG